MSSQPAPARRNPALFALDVAGTVLLLSFLIVLAMVVAGYASGVTQLAADGCAARSAPGPCDSALLSAAGYGMIVAAVLAAFLGLGMAVVSLIRRRLLFVWPLAAIALTVAAYYGGIWLTGVALS